MDMKEARGVDIVGDLLDREFLDRIAQMKVRSVMVSSLLTNRHEVSDALLSIVLPGGYIIVSGPKSFPYCPDPIDTMFRPTIEEMHKHFPGTEPSTAPSSTPATGASRTTGSVEGRSRAVRLMVSFYRPLKW